MSARDYILGIDLGGTRVKLVAVAPDGAELSRVIAPHGGQDWRERVRAEVAALTAALGAARGIGVAAPGLPARDERSIAHMPGRLPGLEGLDWTGFLDAPAVAPVLNDAHAALLGEIWRGAARDASDALLLTLGTGVGGAVVAGGRLLRGHRGRAGHLGHITLQADGPPDIVGTPGSLEDAVGDHTIGRRSAGRYASTSALVADLGRGIAAAESLWARTIRDLAAGLASLINAFDPEVVLLGGGVAEAGEALLAPLARALDAVEWRPGGQRVRVARTQLGELGGAFGAAHRALTFGTILR